jgi:transposase
VITIGIDPHKASLTAVAVDPSGRPLGQRRLLVNAGTLSQLTAWAAGWPARRFAIEGAYGLGRPIAQQLATAGEQVLDVPATLAARARLLNTGGGPKTDAADATSVAQAAFHCPRLRAVAAEDQTTILRLLTERRDDLAGERTRILNRLHGLLRDLVPGGAPTDLSAAKAATLLRRIRPMTATAACRRQLARDLLGDLRRVDARLADNKAQLQDALAATGSTLTQIHGLGVVVAAKLLGHIGDIGRFPSQDHFASYTATAPPGRLQRQPATPPAQPRRQPPTQRRPAHHRGLPGPRPRSRPPLRPAQARRRQDPRRGPPSAQATPGQRHPPTHPGRPTSTPTSGRLTHRGTVEPLPVGCRQDRTTVLEPTRRRQRRLWSDLPAPWNPMAADPELLPGFNKSVARR